ncbi:MAG: hypothetical protein K2K90_09755 [Lachnospiraceae bacterium]|nr:hypothetical protein [Lachnospiraceae bacterium]
MEHTVIMDKRRNCPGRDIAGYLLLGISVVLLGRSLMLCFSNDIWYDELFTVGMVEHSYGEMVRFTAADVHPPLYYCIVKLFVELCKLIAPGAGTVIPAKIVSVVPYFILLLYAVTLMRRRFGMFAGGLFLFCVTAMPQLSAYTVEIRMYGWALLFVTAAFLHAGEIAAAVTETGRRQRRTRSVHGAAFVLYGLAAAYTQYFACVAVVMIYLCVLLVFWFQDRGRIREWLCYVAISVICYVPWLFALTGQLGAVSENYWILPLTWRSLGGCVKFLMKPAFRDDRVNTVLAVILFAAYFVLWCRLAHKLYYNRREIGKTGVKGDVRENSKKSANEEKAGNRTVFREKERFLLATAGVGVLAGLVTFGFAASFLIRPIFVYRYMIPATGCFWLGFVLCLDEILCKPKSGCQDKDDAAEEILCKQKSAQPTEEKSNIGRYMIGRNRIIYHAGIALTVLLVVVGLRDYRAFMGEEEYKIRLMAETEGALATIGPQDVVLYNFDQVQAVTGYYLPKTTARFLWRAEGETLIQEITSPCGMVEDVEEIRKMLEKMQAEGTDSRLWFIGSFNSREEIVDEWRRAGLEVEEMGSFLLERYWFNLYKIS